jgi:hypothetical protein
VRGRQTRPTLRGMSRRTRQWVAVSLILVLTGLAVSWGYTRWGSRPSELAPAFALPASTDRIVRLEEFRGKQPVVLAFHTWSGPEACAPRSS